MEEFKIGAQVVWCDGCFDALTYRFGTIDSIHTNDFTIIEVDTQITTQENETNGSYEKIKVITPIWDDTRDKVVVHNSDNFGFGETAIELFDNEKTYTCIFSLH